MASVFALAILSTATAQEPFPQRSESTGALGKHWTEILALPRQALIFKPTREDITVGKVIFSLYCSSPMEVRLNGVHPDPAWAEIHLTSAGEIVVDKRGNAARDGVWFYISLRQVATNQFELPPLKIERRMTNQPSLLCLSIKAWFNELSNQYDGLFYKNLDDRYALVSYCTSSPDDSPARPRFKQNRVATPEVFTNILSKPFVIELNQRPLREEWGPHPNER